MHQRCPLSLGQPRTRTSSTLVALLSLAAAPSSCGATTEPAPPTQRQPPSDTTRPDALPTSGASGVGDAFETPSGSASGAKSGTTGQSGRRLDASPDAPGREGGAAGDGHALDDVTPAIDRDSDHDSRPAADGARDSAAEARPDDGPTSEAGLDTDRCDIARAAPSSPPRALTLSGNLGVHDPALIAAHGRYYMFQTGEGLGAKTSVDLRSWQAAPRVFSSNPSWIASKVPAATASLWAPDISYFGGQYHLYYSVSSFGSNRSCIGHATRPALDVGSWTDRGAVICSNTGGTSDNWNAIDPNVIIDSAGSAHLAFGSFWGGIKMIHLDGSGARADDALLSLAARPANGGAIEAPFIVRRCGYYYLFVSFDACCKGAGSTYKVMVGRSKVLSGPYLDKSGTPMTNGGGTLVVQGGPRWRGPGHNAVLFTEQSAFNVYHAYDADHDGAPTLRISELVWDGDGWPISGGP